VKGLRLLEIAFNADAEIRGTLFMDRERVEVLTRLVPSTIALTHRCLPDRSRVEAFIEDIYARSYRSLIARHYPTLMNVHDECGSVIAAIGLRPADEGRLFLESYLKQSVETVISEAIGFPVPRDKIVEIGNLASAGKGASVFLFVTLAAYLRQQGLTYAVVTATKSLRGSFALFGFEFRLATADPAVLPDSGASWGSYYRNDPRVVVGAIQPAFAKLEPYLPIEHNGDLARLFARLHPYHSASIQ
jgi:hypothetical protein